MSHVTLKLALHRDAATDDAILVSETGKSKPTWVPRAEIRKRRNFGGKHEDGPRGAKLQVIEIEIPQWLATKKGFT